MKVWALEEGNYSDYHVIGVFSSEQNADRMQSIIGGDVAEWDLDPEMDKINAGLRPYWVRMDRAGNVEEAQTKQSIELYHGGQGSILPDGRFLCDMWASDKDHAIKIANEKRAHAIASGRYKP